MIAYYVHWHYPSTADNELFYGGKDDDKLFHHRENAETYAKNKIDEWDKASTRFDYLGVQDDDFGLTPREREEYRRLCSLFDGDLPDDYTILHKEIKFEDEL